MPLGIKERRSRLKKSRKKVVIFVLLVTFIIIGLVAGLLVYFLVVKPDNATENPTDSTPSSSPTNSPGPSPFPEQSPGPSPSPEQSPLHESNFRLLTGTVGLWLNGKGDVHVTETGDKVFLRGTHSSVDMKVEQKNYGRGETNMTIPIFWTGHVTLSADINVPGLLGGVFLNTEKHQLTKTNFGWYEMKVPIHWDYITQNKHDLTVTITLLDNKKKEDTKLYVIPAFTSPTNL